MEREKWPTRTSFIFAAIGSAIGLGNVWRFPYKCYQYGGGAFLIPYFVALLTAGIPLMILELSIGQKLRASAPMAFTKISKKWGWVGWFAIFISLGIVIYYTVVMSWSLVYLIHSLTEEWGTNAEGFFNSDFLGRTGGPGDIGGIRWPIVLGLAVAWLMIYLIICKGVQRVGKVVYITVPLPLILLFILFLRGATLQGAGDGIEYYLKPDFGELTNTDVWIGAYAQIFFTLSVASGIMIAYASYLPKKSDIANNGIIISLANCGTSFFAGFAVFSVIGYLAYSEGTSIASLEGQVGGPGLAFITYPTAISLMPTASKLIAVIFFVTLISLAIDSCFSMVEAFAAGISDAGFDQKKSVQYTCIVGFVLGLIFCTGAGVHWIEIVGRFFDDFGLIVVGLLECLIVGYILGAKKVIRYVNRVSEIEIGKWWEICIKYVTPVILAVLILYNLYHISSDGIENLSKPGEKYPTWALVVGGWFMITALLILSFILNRRQNKWD